MQAVLFGAWVAVTSVGIYLSPSASGHGTHTQLGLPPCPSVFLFGRPCPGCGMTTSWTQTIHGHFSAAFAAHPFGPITYLLFTLAALMAMYGFVRRLRFSIDGPRTNFALIVLLVCFLSFGIVRMVVDDHYLTASDFTSFRK